MTCPLRRVFRYYAVLSKRSGQMDMGGVAFGRCLIFVYGGDASAWRMTADGVELGMRCQGALEQCQ